MNNCSSWSFLSLFALFIFKHLKWDSNFSVRASLGTKLEDCAAVDTIYITLKC